MKRRNNWRQSKKCPACGEFIRREAILCRYCSTKFIVTPIENSQNNFKENIQ
ncbi:MAG: hypothetical protein IPL98_11735 [Saprospiraceae bacterium]|nr:hypothetical protein [Saprospiraceae bacterium]